jgi:hypothetical protein
MTTQDLTARTLDVTRNATLTDLAASLKDLRTRALDVIVPSSHLCAQGGQLLVSGVEPQITDEGVTVADGRYLPTGIADEGLAGRLDIPLSYVRRLRAENIDLYDQNVNSWLARDDRSTLLRLVRSGSADTGDTHGVCRAVLSDRYKAIDNLDVLLACLQGVRGAGIDPSSLTVTADLTEARMVVRLRSDAITANASALVRNYRDPLSGRTGRDYPMVAAGLRISNSEVGKGGFNLVPYVTFLVCTNGQTMTQDATKAVHLGGKLESGVVTWSSETQQAALRLATSKTADMVRAFMSPEYLAAKVAEMERDAGVEVKDPVKIVPLVAKRVGFTEAQSADILAAFIDGADRTAGGLMQAATYVAQHHPDGEVAAAMEDKALDVLSTTAQLAYAAA